MNKLPLLDPTGTIKKLYRYEYMREMHGFIDEGGDYQSTGYSIRLVCKEYDVKKDHGTSVTINYPEGENGSKLVKLLHKRGEPVKRQFASATKKRALECFLERKKSQLNYLEKDLKDVKLAVGLANDALEKMQNPIPIRG